MEAQTLTVAGKEFVIVPRADFERLRARAGEAEAGLPPLPGPDADGNIPAVAYARALIARRILQARHKAGWSQAELARRSGVRAETISRIENRRHTADPASIERIDRAFRKAKIVS